MKSHVQFHIQRGHRPQVSHPRLPSDLQMETQWAQVPSEWTVSRSHPFLFPLRHSAMLLLLLLN